MHIFSFICFWMVYYLLDENSAMLSWILMNKMELSTWYLMLFLLVRDYISPCDIRSLSTFLIGQYRSNTQLSFEYRKSFQFSCSCLLIPKRSFFCSFRLLNVCIWSSCSKHILFIHNYVNFNDTIIALVA